MHDAEGPEDEAERPDKMRAVTGLLVSRLEQEAARRVSLRRATEQRWLEDLRQYHGVYDSNTLSNLTAANKSRLYLNQTRPKCNACEARLVDMLFPTDDKNWGIGPTPVPELVEQAQRAADEAQRLVEQANEQAQQDPQGAAQLAQAASAHASVEAKLQAEMAEAAKRADAMADEIDDQLRESRYAIVCRDMIRDAVVLGTGVMKGPIVSAKPRQRWVETPDGVVLEVTDDPRPAFVRVDPWDLFPDHGARSVDDVESWFERHVMSRKALRALAKDRTFDAAAIRRVLKADQSRTAPNYINDLRGITGDETSPSDPIFEVWEYRGPLTAEESSAVCDCLGMDRLDDGDVEDPLREINVVMWFCDGEVLKFGPHHMMSGETIYSVYNLERDEASLWGFGIPHLMKDSQSALNAAWRMMMDNAGLSSGPQVEIDTSIVAPADGKYELTARKLWLRKAGASAVNRPGIITYDINSHQPELAGIAAMAKQFIDDETSISTIAQGEQGSHTTTTASGMTLLMNSVNVVFRRIVRNFDDDVTVPNIRRMYDWNMQFSDKQHIKGDYTVDARGSSVLLVRELQSQNLMGLALQTAHPVLGMLLKAGPIVRRLVQSMMLPADEIVKTDEEIQRDAVALQKQMVDAQQQAQQQGAPADNSVEKAKIDSQTRIEVAKIAQETAMMRIAEERNMRDGDGRLRVDVERIRTQSAERKLAAEAAMAERLPANASTGGGSV